jgi:SAM-dependent methyltransferase
MKEETRYDALALAHSTPEQGLGLRTGNLTAFERFYLGIEPFYLPLHRRVRRHLLKISRACAERIDILDVGGRKSHYTIGVPASITVTDLPRETELQKKLNLGISPEIIGANQKRRSNIRKMLYDDMTRSNLPDESFDCVVSVEVLEHVERDDLFVENVRRVLRPGGVFLMTTPNGDAVKNTNPDHKRHYTRGQLLSLLSSRFEEVDVHYAVKGGLFRRKGLRSWSLKHPLRTLLSMMSNAINSLQSSPDRMKYAEKSTHHLIAIARKPY